MREKQVPVDRPVASYWGVMEVEVKYKGTFILPLEAASQSFVSKNTVETS